GAQALGLLLVVEVRAVFAAEGHHGVLAGRAAQGARALSVCEAEGQVSPVALRRVCRSEDDVDAARGRLVRPRRDAQSKARAPRGEDYLDSVRRLALLQFDLLAHEVATAPSD